MTFSQLAASKFVPLLSRIVLCMAFVPAGWNKIIDTSTFEGPAADRLVALGVGDRIMIPPPEAALPAVDEVKEAVEEATEAVLDDEAIDEAIEDVADVTEEAVLAVADSTSVVEARGLHHVTLMVDGAGLGKYAVPLAWTAAITELVGGGLILLGLMSRIWGLGLAIAMGVAFYLTSMDGLVSTLVFDMDVQSFNRLFCQLGLFVLAFGVFLAGAGPMSADRMLFGRGGGNTGPKLPPMDAPPPPPSNRPSIG